MYLSTRKASSLIPGAAATTIAYCAARARLGSSRPCSSSRTNPTRRCLGCPPSLSTSPPPRLRPMQLHRSHPFGELVAAHNTRVLGSPWALQQARSMARTSRTPATAGRVRNVARGILPADVERARSDTGDVERACGATAKGDDEVAATIMDRARGGVLPVGFMSSPEEIQREFPGVSKASFKRAVAELYGQGKVEPGIFTTQLMERKSEWPAQSPDATLNPQSGSSRK